MFFNVGYAIAGAPPVDMPLDLTSLFIGERIQFVIEPRRKHRAAQMCCVALDQSVHKPGVSVQPLEQCVAASEIVDDRTGKVGGVEAAVKVVDNPLPLGTWSVPRPEFPVVRPARVYCKIRRDDIVDERIYVHLFKNLIVDRIVGRIIGHDEVSEQFVVLCRTCVCVQHQRSASDMRKLYQIIVALGQMVAVAEMHRIETLANIIDSPEFAVEKENAGPVGVETGVHLAFEDRGHHRITQ